MVIINSGKWHSGYGYGQSGYWDSVYCDIRDIRFREIGCSGKWMFHAIREIRIREIGIQEIGHFGKMSSSGNWHSAI